MLCESPGGTEDMKGGLCLLLGSRRKNSVRHTGILMGTRVWGGRWGCSLSSGAPEAGQGPRPDSAGSGGDHAASGVRVQGAPCCPARELLRRTGPLCPTPLQNVLARSPPCSQCGGPGIPRTWFQELHKHCYLLYTACALIR